ncbi:MAG: cell division protein FtsL [Pseudohongiella sp.]|nr:cell division protein FtsL [Pseudohongiella sp.]MDO9520876.1 cell division protein FtsL [Pseudohongiella sp.]
MKTTDQHKHSKKGVAQQAAVSVFAWLNLFSAHSMAVVFLMLAVLGSALAVVNISYKHRMVFHELQQSREQTNNLDVQWGQLLIEQSTFGLEGRIERRAMEELGMKLPDWSTIQMVRYE